MAMLEVKDLEVYYGVIQALKGISFDVEQGDIVALICANGAGIVSYTHLKRRHHRAGRKDRRYRPRTWKGHHRCCKQAVSYTHLQTGVA